MLLPFILGMFLMVTIKSGCLASDATAQRADSLTVITCHLVPTPAAITAMLELCVCQIIALMETSGFRMVAITLKEEWKSVT